MENKVTPGESSSGIKEALGKIQVSFVDTNVSPKNSEDGRLEFEFGDSSPSGLVFEEEDSAPVPVSAKTAASATPAPEEKVSAEEFDIPDSFSIDEKYNTVSHENEQTKIWTTYVPRFTEVSEKYRMVNDPRPQKTDSVRLAESTVQGDFDPTAEYDSETIAGEVRIAPGMDVEAEDFSESLSIFKFESEDAGAIPKANQPSEKVKISDSAQSVFEANELPEKEADETAAEPEDTAVEESTETSDIQRASESRESVGVKKEINIPDPKSSELKVFDYSERKNAVAEYRVPPAGVDATGEKTSGEYTAFYQRDKFKDKFLDTLLSSKIRLIAAVVIGLMLLFFENLPYLGVDVTAFLRLTADPWAVSVIDEHLALCMLLIAIPEIAEAAKHLKGRILCPEMLLIPSFLVVTACNAVNIVRLERDCALVGTVFAIHSIAVIFSSSLRKGADFTAFKATSLSGEKKVVDVAPTKTLPAESIALDGAVDGYKSGTVRIFRTSFISDFFKNTAKRNEKSLHVLITFLVALGVALVSGVIALLVLDGISQAMAVFGSVYLLSVPILPILARGFAYSIVQKRISEESSAVIGESSLYNFTNADVITFEDTEIFGAEDVVLKRFMLYGDRENMSKAMRQMSALFAVSGGPLDHIFANALEKRSLPATAAVIESDGISGNVDGKRVCAGNFEYMLRHGIDVNSDRQNTDNGADTTRIMYAAEDGAVYAKFYIRYSFSEEFSALLPALLEKNIVPLVYTRDPNVTNELLRTLTASRGAMRVMKKNDLGNTASEHYSKIGAGMVTFGDKMNAIRSLLMAKKYSEKREKSENLTLIISAVGCAASCVLGLAGVVIPSAIGALWQIIAGAIGSVAFSKAFISMKKTNEDESAQNGE